MSKNDLVKLVTAYRNELKTSRELFKAYAQENFAEKPLHKVASARKVSRIEVLTEDFNVALKGE